MLEYYFELNKQSAQTIVCPIPAIPEKYFRTPAAGVVDTKIFSKRVIITPASAVHDYCA